MDPIVIPPEELAPALDAALAALWPARDEAAASSRRVYRPVVAIALDAALPAIAAAIANRLHPHRFDLLDPNACIGEQPPDSYYSGIVDAEDLVRSVTAAAEQQPTAPPAD